jgi:predicted acetyltransferase
MPSDPSHGRHAAPRGAMDDAERVTLEPAGAEHASLLANLLELYSHDLSEIFGLEVGPDGRFGYENLPLYWSQPNERRAFLIRRGRRVAGFILVRVGSPIADVAAELDVAEFFVLRAHRRSGVGCRAAFQLWDGMPGSWMVRVAAVNAPARSFWEPVIDAYTAGAFTESRRSVEGRDWHVFVFTSPERSS